MNTLVRVILSEAKNLHEDAVFFLRFAQNDIDNCYPDCEPCRFGCCLNSVIMNASPRTAYVNSTLYSCDQISAN